MIVERDGRPIYANRASAVMFGYRKPAEVLALPSLAVLFAGDDRARVQRYWRAYAGKIPAPKAFECRGVKKDGSIVWLDVRVQSCSLDGAAASLWTIADVTLRKIYEDRLHHQANFDPVTHLPNRWLALDRLVHAIVTGRRRFRKVGVLFIDIDDFKAINDTFGHATGDRFLRQLGERIRLCVREEDTVARIGGDEFTVVLPDLRSVADAEQVARKILEAVAAPFSLDGREAFVGASIGITISPEDGVDAETLLGNADAAMYKAKSSGRNQLRFFTPELNARTICRNRAEARLKSALASEELRVLYQPIVSLEGGQIIGAEALLRWHDPELGIVDAEHFIRVAEETGLIVPIGAWTMSMACRDAARWRRNGRGLFVSVNVCGREFRTKSLAEEVLGGLRQHELPANGFASRVRRKRADAGAAADRPRHAPACRRRRSALRRRLRHRLLVADLVEPLSAGHRQDRRLADPAHRHQPGAGLAGRGDRRRRPPARGARRRRGRGNRGAARPAPVLPLRRGPGLAVQRALDRGRDRGAARCARAAPGSAARSAARPGRRRPGLIWSRPPWRPRAGARRPSVQATVVSRGSAPIAAQLRSEVSARIQVRSSRRSVSMMTAQAAPLPRSATAAA